MRANGHDAQTAEFCTRMTCAMLGCLVTQAFAAKSVPVRFKPTAVAVAPEMASVNLPIYRCAYTTIVRNVHFVAFMNE